MNVPPRRYGSRRLIRPPVECFMPVSIRSTGQFSAVPRVRISPVLQPDRQAASSVLMSKK